MNKDIVELTKIISNEYKISNDKSKKIIEQIRSITKKYIQDNNLKSLVKCEESW